VGSDTTGSVVDGVDGERPAMTVEADDGGSATSTPCAKTPAATTNPTATATMRDRARTAMEVMVRV
jgi:hypothetical protein